MKHAISLLYALLLIINISSCHLFSMDDRFKKVIRQEGRYSVLFIKSNDGRIVTAEIVTPKANTILINGSDLSKVMSQNDINKAVITYVGPWRDCEKIIKPNYEAEYRKWGIKEGFLHPGDTPPNPRCELPRMHDSGATPPTPPK